MHKSSMIGAIILSCILPGAGLLLVQKGGWFVLYLLFDIVGIFLLFFFGLGVLILGPLWIISIIHTILAVNKHNGLATAK